MFYCCFFFLEIVKENVLLESKAKPRHAIIGKGYTVKLFITVTGADQAKSSSCISPFMVLPYGSNLHFIIAHQPGDK